MKCFIYDSQTACNAIAIGCWHNIMINSNYITLVRSFVRLFLKAKDKFVHTRIQCHSIWDTIWIKVQLSQSVQVYFLCSTLLIQVFTISFGLKSIYRMPFDYSTTKAACICSPHTFPPHIFHWALERSAWTFIQMTHACMCASQMTSFFVEKWNVVLI